MLTSELAEAGNSPREHRWGAGPASGPSEHRSDEAENNFEVSIAVCNWQSDCERALTSERSVLYI
jgi:hypothetical protein